LQLLRGWSFYGFNLIRYNAGDMHRATVFEGAAERRRVPWDWGLNRERALVEEMPTRCSLPHRGIRGIFVSMLRPMFRS
jgi:hypothetical protein